MDLSSLNFGGLGGWFLVFCCVAPPVIAFLVDWWRNAHRNRPPGR